MAGIKITWLDKLLFYDMRKKFIKEMERDQEKLDKELEELKLKLQRGIKWQESDLNGPQINL